MNLAFHLPSIHQIYPDLAAFLHADHPEPEKPDRTYEADPGRRIDPRQEPALNRRFHRPRHPARRNDRIPVSERCPRQYISVRLVRPLLFGCKYLNFSRSNSELDLITRRIIRDREGDNISQELLDDYANPDSQNYKEMVEEIRKRLNFTSLQFHRLDDLIESIGLEPCKLCTYCWNGKE